MSHPEYEVGRTKPAEGRMIMPDPVTTRRIGLINVMAAAILIVTCTLPSGVAAFYSPVIARIGQRLGKPMRDTLVDRAKKNIQELARKEAKETNPTAKANLAQRRKELEATIPSLQMSPTMGFDAMQDVRVRSFTILDMVVMLALNVWMLFAGIGLLGLRAWGRKAAIWVALVKLVQLAIYTAFQIVWLIPLQVKAMAPQLAVQQRAVGAAGAPFVFNTSFMAGVSYASLFVMVTISALYSLLLLFFLFKPSVRVACRDIEKPDSELFPT